MFDPNTERMIEYWRARRDGRAAPLRAAIDPAGFPRLASRVFIAQLTRNGEVVFRLAGDAVEELLGGPLRGVALAGFWRAAHRQPLLMAIDAALANASPLVVGAHAAVANGAGGALEMLFAPLIGATGVADQLLGYCQKARDGHPIDPPVRELSIRRLDGADLRPRATLRLAAVDGERIA